MNHFDAASPFDARYYFTDEPFYTKLRPYVSESAQIGYLAQVEAALAKTLAEYGVCTQAQAAEIAIACTATTPAEVYEEENRIQHNIKALVNCINSKVRPATRPYVHLSATSSDIMDTARSLCLKDVTALVIIPDLVRLITSLIKLARQHADTPQIGRTHGQHAVPITFGFALALYVSRLGQRLNAIAKAASELQGKLAGAVGAYNATSLLYRLNPRTIECSLMFALGLKPSEISSQIVPPEPQLDYLYAITSCWGVLANLADDFRHLQRSEIRELTDKKATLANAVTVGSSTMPHKVNPKDFENVKSLWKAYMPRLTTALMDQISEHQRDLTNSASTRFSIEHVAAFAYAIHRTQGALDATAVNKDRMAELVQESKDNVIAEPLYISLALAGHQDAHEEVRVISRQARQQNTTVAKLLKTPEIVARLQPYFVKMTKEQREILDDPALYVGTAASTTHDICSKWEAEISKVNAAL